MQKDTLTDRHPVTFLYYHIRISISYLQKATIAKILERVFNNELWKEEGLCSLCCCKNPYIKVTGYLPVFLSVLKDLANQ